MMLFAAKTLAAGAVLLLATTGTAGAAPATGCAVGSTPSVSVKVLTDDIRYDYSRSARDLSAADNDTVSPYAPGTDTVSGGLREDRPVIKTAISWNVLQDRRRNTGCMWYDDITVSIQLSPKIYLAREFNTGACREAVLAHERLHVKVDREVMNVSATRIGNAVKAAVDRSGALGPFRLSDQEQMKTESTRVIEEVIDAQRQLLEKEMRRRQAIVDSLEEYERVNAQCQNVKVTR